MHVRHLLGFGYSALMHKLFNKRVPLNVMLSVTDRCNATCNYCDIKMRKSEELDTDDIFFLIDQLVNMGTQRLGLWGGEPLLRDDVGRIVDYAKSKRLFVTLDTNAFLLPERIKDIKNIDYVVIAFDGDEESHNMNRGQGSYRKMRAGLETVLGKIPVLTITVLTKHNLRSVDYILKTASEEGFKVTFQLLHHNDILAAGSDCLMPKRDELRAVIEHLKLKKTEGAPIVSSIGYFNHLLNWHDYSRFSTDKRSRFRCFAGDLYCNVDTNGDIYPCSLLIGKCEAQNFKVSGFRQSFDALDRQGCESCIASCFNEYNALFALHSETVTSWIKGLSSPKAKGM